MANFAAIVTEPPVKGLAVRFSSTAFSCTVLAVIISGAISWAEGTLTNKRVTMGFLNHGGMWSDLIVMPVVMGLAVPYFVRNRSLVISLLLFALVVTVIAHILWARWFRADRITGHIFPSHETGTWYLDISTAGWMHVLVMTLLLAAMFMYSLSPLPVEAVVGISLLLTVHMFIATLQPGWYCTGKLWSWTNFGPPILATFAVWSIAMLKILFARIPA